MPCHIISYHAYLFTCLFSLLMFYNTFMIFFQFFSCSCPLLSVSKKDCKKRNWIKKVWNSTIVRKVVSLEVSLLLQSLENLKIYVRKALKLKLHAHHVHTMLENINEKNSGKIFRGKFRRKFGKKLGKIIQKKISEKNLEKKVKNSEKNWKKNFEKIWKKIWNKKFWKNSEKNSEKKFWKKFWKRIPKKIWKKGKIWKKIRKKSSEKNSEKFFEKNSKRNLEKNPRKNIPFLMIFQISVHSTPLCH